MKVRGGFWCGWGGRWTRYCARAYTCSQFF